MNDKLQGERELLPCPFCGGQPQERTAEDGGKYIGCNGCNASTALHYDRAENLVAAWNRRAALARDAEPVAYIVVKSDGIICAGMVGDIKDVFPRTLTKAQAEDLHWLLKYHHPENQYAILPVQSPPLPDAAAPPSTAQAVEAALPTEEELLDFADAEELFLFADREDFLAIANGVLELVTKKLRLIPTEAAQVERDAKDAARYRWILNNAAATNALWGYAFPDELMRERHISNAIDAAIASANREG